MAGCRSAVLADENGRPNHLLLIEVWRSAKDLDALKSSERYKRFRSDIQPMLASPFDERTGFRIAPEASARH